MKAETQNPNEKDCGVWVGTCARLAKMRRGRRRRAGALRIQAALVTLNSELNEASSFSIRVDGVTGEEDRVLTLCWL